MRIHLQRAPLPPGGRRYAVAAALAAAMAFALPRGAAAYVFLDTSAPTADSAVPADTLPRTMPRSPAADTAAAATTGPRRGPPHYRAVLFLSADSKLIYAYIGILKALEQYGLAPDAVLAESKAAAVGAAWALGYGAGDIENWFLGHPLDSLLRPEPGRSRIEERAFRPDGRDPPQWDVPLSLDAFQSRSLKWSEVTGGENGEYLRLSWAVARLTHDAPAGPVENLEAAPRPLAVQVSDLESAREAVVTEGSLQAILKGSLLPDEVVRRRPRLWPYASGALLSGHAVMADRLPFTCDRIILVDPGRRLRPPALQPHPLPWTDSLALRAKALAVAQDAETFPAGLQAQALRIVLEPGQGFDPDEPDPGRWIELGYTSALRSMDVLKSALPALDGAPSPPPESREPLGLNRLSVNPLAPGGNQLLLDILRATEGDAPDSSGEKAIAALTASGFYDDLDVEWAKGSEREKALLVFDAREKTGLRFRAGWSALVDGDDMRERPPELFGGIFWNEPFYIPIEAAAGAALGGNRPGFGWRLAIAPIYPWRMRLGLGYAFTQADFEPPSQGAAARSLGGEPFPIRYRRRVLQGFLGFYPSPRFWSRSVIRSDSVTIYHRVDDLESSQPSEPDSLKSVDFLETVHLGLGPTRDDGSHAASWTGRFRYVNPIVTSGFPRPGFSSAESELRLGWRALSLIDQYYWSDQNPAGLSEMDLFEGAGAFDLMQAGRIDAFTFQDDYFLRYLRSARFQDVRAEFAPVWGRGGLKLTAGAWRNYGSAFFPEQRRPRDVFGFRFPGRAHWEIQAGYSTPLGTLRVGAGGLGGEPPFYYLRLGSAAFAIPDFE